MKRLSALSGRLVGGLLAFSQSIRNGLPSSAKRLARSLAVAFRTVKRDLAYLRAELGLGAGGDSACHRDFLVRPGVAQPEGLFSGAETLSVFVSRQTRAGRGGTAVKRIHAERIRRRESRFDGGQRPSMGGAATPASLRAPAPEDLAAGASSHLPGPRRDRWELCFPIPEQGGSPPQPWRRLDPEPSHGRAGRRSGTPADAPHVHLSAHPILAREKA